MNELFPILSLLVIIIGISLVLKRQASLSKELRDLDKSVVNLWGGLDLYNNRLRDVQTAVVSLEMELSIQQDKIDKLSEQHVRTLNNAISRLAPVQPDWAQRPQRKSAPEIHARMQPLPQDDGCHCSVPENCDGSCREPF